MPRDFTAADWKGDTARGARYASEQRAREYDRLAARLEKGSTRYK